MVEDRLDLAPHRHRPVRGLRSDHEIGKLVESTRYNLVGSTLEYCPSGCIDPESVTVRHQYGYDDGQGLLTDRTTTVAFGGELALGGNQRFSLGYEYDRFGNVSVLSYPELTGLAGCLEAPQLTFTWDAIALKEVKDENLVSVFETVYDVATGLLKTWTTPAGTGYRPVRVAHLVTPDGTRPRPSQIKAFREGGGSTYFDSGLYGYDAAGNISAIGSWQYGYDPLQRLSSAASPANGTRSFTYDDFGNMVHSGVQQIAVDPATNRLSGVTYDWRGNVVLDPTDQGWQRHFRFDMANRLVAAWGTGTSAPAESAESPTTSPASGCSSTDVRTGPSLKARSRCGRVRQPPHRAALGAAGAGLRPAPRRVVQASGSCVLRAGADGQAW